MNETTEQVAIDEPPEQPPPPRIGEPIDMRWVLKTAVITPRSQCLACGAEEGTAGLHDVVVCPACNTAQCANYAQIRGTCPVCLIGILPHITPNPGACQRKGCTNPAAAWLLGSARCVAHVNEAKPYYINGQLLYRHNEWFKCGEVYEPV